jgi:hypothetical protein
MKTRGWRYETPSAHLRAPVGRRINAGPSHDEAGSQRAMAVTIQRELENQRDRLQSQVAALLADADPILLIDQLADVLHANSQTEELAVLLNEPGERALEPPRPPGGNGGLCRNQLTR